MLTDDSRVRPRVFQNETKCSGTPHPETENSSHTWCVPQYQMADSRTVTKRQSILESEQMIFTTERSVVEPMAWTQTRSVL